MKRILALFCMLSFLLPLFAFTASAASEDVGNEDDVNLTVQEQSVLREKLNAYGYGDEEFTADVLYDADDCPTYLLGTTKEGYLILERNSCKFQECGEGNPYENYMTSKKYYGGAICYFVQLSGEESTQAEAPGEYYDIIRETYSSFVPRLDTNGEAAGQQEPRAAASPTSISGTIRVADNDDYIRRRAFGNNTDNTCSAVATGIALNYIAFKHNMAIIPDYLIPEGLNKGLISEKNPISSAYPRANKFHRYIADSCGMGPGSFNAFVVLAVKMYNSNMIPSKYNFKFGIESTPLPKASTIKNNIQNDKPVLITTTFWGGEYNWHTMCVYGYRDTSDGPQLLVHTGWYSTEDNERISGTRYRQKEAWIDESIATYGYYFSFHNPLASFNDIPIFTHWAYPGILYVVNRGLMNGTTSTTFAPGHAMSRAMLVSTLYRMAGSPSVTYTNTFSDVPKSAWYANSVI